MVKTATRGLSVALTENKQNLKTRDNAFTRFY